MRAFVCVVLGTLMAAGATSSVADLPYASDLLMVEFAGWAKGMHRPLIVVGQTYESGGWKDAQWLCTAPVIYASERYLYGLTVDHCIAESDSRRIAEIRVRDLPVTVLPFRNGTNTVRIWRGENTIGARGVLIYRAKEWHPGVQVFVFGYKRLGNKLEGVVSTGRVGTWTGWEEPDSGDILHDAPVWYGWSGGGVYVYSSHARRFEILALTEEILGKVTHFGTVFSQFSFAYSVPGDVYEYLEREAASAFPSIPSPSASPSANRGRFSNWQETPPNVQARWSALYHANATYTLEPFVAVLTDGERFPIGPKETVMQAWLKDRLKARGKLQDVDWSEFEYRGGD